MGDRLLHALIVGILMMVIGFLWDKLRSKR